MQPTSFFTAGKHPDHHHLPKFLTVATDDMTASGRDFVLHTQAPRFLVEMDSGVPSGTAHVWFLDDYPKWAGTQEAMGRVPRAELEKLTDAARLFFLGAHDNAEEKFEGAIPAVAAAITQADEIANGPDPQLN